MKFLGPAGRWGAAIKMIKEGSGHHEGDRNDFADSVGLHSTRRDVPSQPASVARTKLQAAINTVIVNNQVGCLLRSFRTESPPANR